MNNKKEIRVRFAPSPTGELHIGSLRTALICFLFARKNDGKFLMRVEDTDRKRFVEGASFRQLQDLYWAGIEVDEGVVLDGDTTKEVGEFGPYTQSHRKDIYAKYVEQLVNEDKAYPCFCSADRLREMREIQQAQKIAPKYDRKCLELSKDEIKEKIEAREDYVIRFKIPEGSTKFTDLVYGDIEVENENLDDLVIMKSDGFPTYHLAVVVDDYLMKISHIFRGMEWIPSTPKHVLLYEAFGWSDEMPEFCHMVNILNKNKKKLSKREGGVSVADFRNEGYPKEAIINFIALLGWNPKTQQEIFTMNDLIEQFDVSKMNKAGGVFDLDRLAWMSKEHIKKMSVDEIYSESISFLQEKDYFKNATEARQSELYIKKIITVEQDRLERFTAVGEDNKFFFTDVVIDKELLKWKDNSFEETKETLTRAKDILTNINEDDWTRKNLEKILMNAAGDKRGDFLWPLRSALTGEKRSPGPFDCAWVFGKEESLTRIQCALDLL
ncbi:MAG TPA: glutamate--tRNA ligase [Candidatus Pacebacteria bacterium]|nr:glutamate--tRNA ligase [Candidatus Paceibacterota bacterium]